MPGPDTPAPDALKWRAALEAIVATAEADLRAYHFDPSFHAVVEIARRALEEDGA
jgi:hypothetical protein